MGGSRWSDDFYKDREDDRLRSGKSAFDYDVRLKRDPSAKKAVHQLKTMVAEEELKEVLTTASNAPTR